MLSTALTSACQGPHVPFRLCPRGRGGGVYVCVRKIAIKRKDVLSKGHEPHSQCFKYLWRASAPLCILFRSLLAMSFLAPWWQYQSVFTPSYPYSSDLKRGAKKATLQEVATRTRSHFSGGATPQFSNMMTPLFLLSSIQVFRPTGPIPLLPLSSHNCGRM